MGYIRDIVVENSLNVLDANICGDHVHMVLVCGWEERSNIIRMMKGRSAQMYLHPGTGRNKGLQPLVGSHDPLPGTSSEPQHLWAQKYHYREIKNERYLQNALEYVHHNRSKHFLPPSKQLEEIIESM